MSIIPLVRGKDAHGHDIPIDHWTVVKSQEEFGQTGHQEGHAVLIGGLDEKQLAPGKLNTSYDLRVGPEYKDHRDVGKKKETGRRIKLLPGAAVIIQTEEEVHFPKEMFGYIVPKVGLLQDGISNTVSKVDPGYHGPLLVTLFNLGKKTIDINHLAPFCSLSVHRVEPGANPYNGQPKRLVGTTGPTWQWVKDTIDANHVTVLIALTLVELAHVLLDAFHLWPHR